MSRLFAVALVAGVVATAGCAARVDPEAERRRQEQISADHDANMSDGLAALKAERYDDAIAAFSRAAQLMPGDGDAADMLRTAKRAKQAQLDAAYEQAFAAGKDAANAGRHRAAREQFAAALKIRPNDPKATAERDKSEGPALVEQGREELEGKRYAEALRTLAAAAQRMPGDKAVVELLNKAREARRAEVGPEFDKHLAAAKAASASKDFPTAIKAAGDALALVPGDPIAATLKADAEFERHLTRGEAALTGNRPGDAVREFEAATKLRPTDDRAADKLASARAAKQTADFARYDKLVTSAKAAMAAKRYRDAIPLFKEAEAYQPGAAHARHQRQEAERVIAEYDQWVSRAKGYIRSKKYDDAVYAATQAAALMPAETEPALLQSEAAKKKQDRRR
jgi:tetratricopeptide (TPR) repeat protein